MMTEAEEKTKEEMVKKNFDILAITPKVLRKYIYKNAEGDEFLVSARKHEKVKKGAKIKDDKEELVYANKYKNLDGTIINE